MSNMIKMEDTFLMVRDCDVKLIESLNDMPIALGERIVPANHNMMVASAFRNLPDEAAEF